VADPRVIVVDGGTEHDVFEVLELADGVARVRSPYLFEIGEELAVRFAQDGAFLDGTARVRGHSGPPEDPVTELELSAAQDR
jgi:hypothetical protein